MQKLITFLTLSLGFTSIASAHMLDAGEGLLPQLYHELLGVHHLPLTILLIAVGVAILWMRHRRSRGIAHDDR